ncbi:MAG: primosomal protein N' [Armatimonadetes bacterium]|nr:primosomal protein N' [Armatimonadota bacterium]
MAPDAGPDLVPAARQTGASYVEVTIDRPAEALDRPFTYRLPPRLAAQVELGSYVLVPFGRQPLCGFVTGFASGPGELAEDAVKDIEAVLGEMAFFDQAMLTVARRIASYYRCLLIDVLRCMLPEGLTQKVERVVSWTGNEDVEKALLKLDQVAPQQARLLRAIQGRGGRISMSELKDMFETNSKLSNLVRLLRERGLINTETILEPPTVAPKMVLTAMLAQPAEVLEERLDELRRQAPKQARILELLVQAGRPVAVGELVKLAETSHAAVRQLELKELVLTAPVESRRVVEGGGLLSGDRRHTLTDQQANAIATIRAEMSLTPPRPILIHGVTASGKTEVYLQVIADVLEAGRQVIVLVPEISLTVQTIDIFRGRFGERVAILHSALNPGERFDEWRRVARGQVDICVGARSAVFAPFRKLGLIVVDEEHETSYKQDSAPRYHARQVALWRAQVSGAAVVLGSATPSVESYQRARQGRYALVEMPQRVAGRPFAQVEVVDLREARAPGPRQASGPVHHDLIEAIRERRELGEQTILFLNRRGFAPVLQCRACGYVAVCEHCDVSLVLHQESRQLQCHHCDYVMPLTETCLSCGEAAVKPVGFGTERLEHWLNQVLPEARVLRLDRDTTRRKNAHAQILSRFRRKEADILLGTQMVAKGLDFDNVTLVGVIAADVALNLPDFRAAERTFQLLCQVAGRAGRGDRRGVVLIQTYNPEHPAVVAARAQDFLAFFESEVADREAAGYPPFMSLARLVVHDEHENDAALRCETIAAKVAEAFDASSAWGELLGPAPCPLSKIRDQFRFHVMIKVPGSGMLQRVMDALEPLLSGDLRQGLTIDVDPISML